MVVIGKKYNKWLVLDSTTLLNSSRQRYYKCECDCGNITNVLGVTLRSGKTQGCSKCANNKVVEIGQYYGNWLVTAISGNKSKIGHIYYICQCKCGNKSDIRADALRSKKTLGCRECFSAYKCKFCGCKSHRIIEDSECDLLGFCKRCDDFCCFNCSINVDKCSN